MTDIIKSILAINNKAEVTVNADDINQITWLNGTTPIPANEILSKQQELITEYNGFSNKNLFILKMLNV